MKEKSMAMETETDKQGAFPLSGLVICVTGLSKEARKQVMEGTERLGGIYSPNLHPNCTHLILSPYNSFRGGRKLHHALNHPLSFTNPLFLVTLPWFLDSLSASARLPESSYSLYPFPLPSSIPQQNFSASDGSFQTIKHSHSHLSGRSVYIDSYISPQLHTKVVDVIARHGAMLVNHWFVGCAANYVVCEGSSIHKYLGHCDNIVSPIWFLKTPKQSSMPRFGCLSTDLAREAGLMLENLRHVNAEQENNEEKSRENVYDRSGVDQAERLRIVKLAKYGIRQRRARRLQSCEVPLRPINSSSLLDSICWSISEPTSTVAVYENPLLSKNDCGVQTDILQDGQERIESDLSFSNLLRPLKESERSELIFRNHFITILFPVDRFAEMGPSSRTYFSDSGFTCLQLLDFIYDFYQESMSDNEMQAAIHTDSRHADLLRSMYCSDRTRVGDMVYKRIQFIGSRKSFEKLKRVSGDNNSNVYELVIRE